MAFNLAIIKAFWIKHRVTVKKIKNVLFGPKKNNFKTHFKSTKQFTPNFQVNKLDQITKRKNFLHVL